MIQFSGEHYSCFNLPTIASIWERFVCKCSVKRSVTVLRALQSFNTGHMSLKKKMNGSHYGLFTVPYFSVRLSRLSALAQKPSWMSVKTT